MQFVSQIFHTVQNYVSNISFSNPDPRLLIIVAAIVLLAVASAFKKSTAIYLLLGVYAIVFIAMQISTTSSWLTEHIGSSKMYYVQLGVGALPMVALLLYKFKKTKKSGGGA